MKKHRCGKIINMTSIAATQLLARSSAKKNGKTYKAVIAGWADAIPLGRLAQPEEIANLVVFLSSKRASYITDATIQLDRGYIKSIF